MAARASVRTSSLRWIAIATLASTAAGGRPASAAPPTEETLDSVFIVGVVRADGQFENVGTAWTIRENWLATNAHVAEGLLEITNQNPGSRMVARRGRFDLDEI